MALSIATIFWPSREAYHSEIGLSTTFIRRQDLMKAHLLDLGDWNLIFEIISQFWPGKVSLALGQVEKTIALNFPPKSSHL